MYRQHSVNRLENQGRRSEKHSEGAEGSEGETHIRVEGGVLLEANPRKSCNRFLNNLTAEFGLKHHIICGAKLAYVRFHFSSANIKMRNVT